MLSKYQKLDCTTITMETLQDKCHQFLKDFSPSLDQIHSLEKMTRSQSRSVLWHRHREGHITASVAHDILTMKDQTSPDRMLKKIMNYTHSDISSIEAVGFGIQHEEKAKAMYRDYMKTTHECFDVQDSGLVIDPAFSLFGASPDGVRTCHCHGQGLLEIKCSFKHKDRLVSEVPLLDKDFCLEKDTFLLKHNHRYYTQVQFQMYVCHKMFCDFVVYTLKGINMQTVYYDPHYVQRLIGKCSAFAFQHLIPEILSRKLQDNES